MSQPNKTLSLVTKLEKLVKKVPHGVLRTSSSDLAADLSKAVFAPVKTDDVYDIITAANEFAVLLDNLYENEWHLGRVLCVKRDVGEAPYATGGWRRCLTW